MADGFTSPGLMANSHFRYSKVSREMYEPVYVNLFTVQIELPKGLQYSEDDQNLLLEGVKKVSGLDTNRVPGAVEQHYKMSDRSFANSGTDNTHIDLKLDFEINLRNAEKGAPDMYTLKMLRAWDDLIWDPLTGRQGLKVNYTAPRITITMHTKDNQPFWQWICYNCFPTTSINAPELDYSQKSGIYSVNGYTLRCDWWDETML